MLDPKKIFGLVIVFFALFAGTANAYEITLDSPADLSDCQPLTVDLVWEDHAEAVTYGIEIVESSSYTPVAVVGSGLSSNTFTVSGLEYNTEYIWAVSATFTDNSSTWSSIWSFTTIPAPPTPVGPEDGIACMPKQFDIHWEDLANVENYIVQIASDPDFNSIVQNINDLTSNTFTASVPFYGTQYWWRVAAQMTTCQSGFSEPRSVKTKTAPPILLEPADEIGGVALDTFLEWGQVAGANNYDIELDNNPDFSSPEYQESGLTSNTFSVVLQDYNANYYWRVIANDGTCASPWSQTFSFTTKYEAPEIVSPYDGEDCVSLLPKYQWKPVDGAGLYTLQVAEDENFENIIYEKDEIGGVSHSAPLTQPLTEYYWRVRAEDDENSGYFSNPALFTTTLLPPEMIKPESGNNAVPLNATFEWGEISEGTVYHMQVADNQDFDPILHDRELSDQTSYDYTLPENSTQYFWRISATFSNCASTWTQPVDFRTILGAPVLQSPEDESTAQPVNMLFQWKESKDAEFYDVRIALDEDFEQVVNGQSNVPQNALLIKDLDANTKYFWKVRARNEYSTSEWSDIWEFTTGVRGPAVPELIYPEHKEVMVPTSLTFTWHEADRADSYRFMLGKDDDFEVTVIDEEDIGNNFLEVTNLDYYTEYFWKVQSVNDSGRSAWSQIWKFRTTALAPSDAPELWTPLDGADNLHPEVDFTWYSTPRAEYYHLQIATDVEFNNIEQEEKRVWETNETIYNLPLNTQFYWRVKAINEAGEGPWSDYWSFETYDPAGVDDGIPGYFNISVFPNPAADHATFEFELPEAGHVNIKIYNSLGEMVSTLLNDFKSAGEHNVDWDTESLESGVYIYSVISGEHSQTGQVVVSK